METRLWIYVFSYCIEFRTFFSQVRLNFLSEFIRNCYLKMLSSFPFSLASCSSFLLLLLHLVLVLLLLFLILALLFLMLLIFLLFNDFFSFSVSFFLFLLHFYNYLLGIKYIFQPFLPQFLYVTRKTITIYFIIWN